MEDVCLDENEEYAVQSESENIPLDVNEGCPVSSHGDNTEVVATGKNAQPSMYPLARVLRIAKLTPRVKKISKEGLFAIGCAAAAFTRTLAYLTAQRIHLSAAESFSKPGLRLATPEDLLRAIQAAGERYAFLQSPAVVNFLVPKPVSSRSLILSDDQEDAQKGTDQLADSSTQNISQQPAVFLDGALSKATRPGSRTKTTVRKGLHSSVTSSKRYPTLREYFQP